MLLILHALIPCLHIIYCTCFPTFWHCHPYILQHLMEVFLLLPFRCILACKYNALCLCASPSHFFACGHVKRM